MKVRNWYRWRILAEYLFHYIQCHGREERYEYDVLGRTIPKADRTGYRSAYNHTADGWRVLYHYDDQMCLESYRYEYDLMGNKTAVTKERRGLREESGRYVYGYDALSRLVSVSRDGNALREYAYDAFGNRSSMEDYGRGRNISYTYDALNRLTSTEEDRLDAVMQENTVHTDYYYDNRGNNRLSES